MTITVKGKEYELNFGIGFVRELDKTYFIKNANGATFGIGLETKLPSLLTRDVPTLADLIYIGTHSCKARPTQKDIDTFIDEVEDIDALFDEVIEELKKQNATQRVILKTEEILAKQK